MRNHCAILLYLLVFSLIALSSTTVHASRAAHIVRGQSTQVCGAPVSTWAEVGPNHRVLAVGVTVPLCIAQNPPAKPGKGPVGAVAVLRFPKVVQETTFFNHFEMQWNPHGHPPACCFGLPHFDFHFYGIPVAREWKFGPRDPRAPASDRMPAGYVYPGADQCVPNMGVHAVRPRDVTPGHPFIISMVAGFYGGNMNFIEPMVTRYYLLGKKSFSLDVPMPAVLGRQTLYPTRFRGTYDSRRRAYRLVFSGFREMKS
jgi:hypothetical protein